jgi:putative sigma-54 modulation protein
MGMRLDIRADRHMSAAFLRAYIERHLHAFERQTGRVMKVSVEVGDANGPRGGVDKYCRISAELAGLSSVFVEAVDADAQLAVDVALRRIERAVTRAMLRARERTSESARTRPAELAQEG